MRLTYLHYIKTHSTYLVHLTKYELCRDKFREYIFNVGTLSSVQVRKVKNKWPLTREDGITQQ